MVWKSDSSNTSSDEYFIHHLKIHKATSQGDQKTCTIFINDIKITVEPDMGADTNIMDEYQFWKLQTERPEMALQESTIKLKALNQDLPIMRECTMKLENQTRAIMAAIVVVKGKIDSLPLLGRPSLDKLAMLKINETGRLKEPKLKIENENPELEKIQDQYKNLFQGVGKATRDSQEIQIHLLMKEDAIPIAKKPSPISSHWTTPGQNWRVYHEGPRGESPPLRSYHLVLTNRCASKAQEPWRHQSQPGPPPPKQISACTWKVQAPITEDFVAEFRHCEVFSMVTILDPKSHKTVTFFTPWGNYWYKYWAFGGVNSQVLFDTEISEVVSGIPKVLNNHVDIMRRAQQVSCTSATETGWSQPDPVVWKVWIWKSVLRLPQTLVYTRRP